ncbi:DUF6153 family protein [Nocardioides sp. P86]|uniref:DUF6153 family protein n=1 Tax=Nocardioides sp. P86 TaxID=2939569 RepID=UPI00203C7291|nr:DUF6153 family protein [Nocardioides sp. P86]MCM3515148.1 DUF6153 family protein [Nocardioides sp. P86]
MGPTTSTGRAVPGLLAAVVVSIVLGILGMHALSTHGVMGEADHGGHPAMSGMSSDTAAPAESLVLDPVADPVADPAVDGSGSDEGGGHDMGGMVMLCAAMLAATAAALLLLAALGTRHTPRFWALLPTAATTVTTGWVASRLGTGPPPVWEFSVIRC